MHIYTHNKVFLFQLLNKINKGNQQNLDAFIVYFDTRYTQDKLWISCG